MNFSAQVVVAAVREERMCCTALSRSSGKSSNPRDMDIQTLGGTDALCLTPTLSVSYAMLAQNAEHFTKVRHHCEQIGGCIREGEPPHADDVPAVT